MCIRDRVQRVHPFRIEAGQHLVDHDQQVELLARLGRDALVGPLVGKAGGQVGLEVRVRAQVELLPVGGVVVSQDFNEARRLERGVGAAAGIVVADLRVKQRGDVQLRALCLQQPVVGDGLRDAGRGKNRVEFAALAQGCLLYTSRCV